jgi:hypothetical protein
MKNFNNEQYNKPNYSIGRITDFSSTGTGINNKFYNRKKLPIKYINQQDIDNLQSQINKLKGELVHLKEGFSREDEFYKKLIVDKIKVIITLQSEIITGIVVENYKYGLVIEKESPRKNNKLFIQKSNIIYLEFP